MGEPFWSRSSWHPNCVCLCVWAQLRVWKVTFAVLFKMPSSVYNVGVWFCSNNLIMQLLLVGGQHICPICPFVRCGDTSASLSGTTEVNLCRPWKADETSSLHTCKIHLEASYSMLHSLAIHWSYEGTTLHFWAETSNSKNASYLMQKTRKWYFFYEADYFFQLTAEVCIELASDTQCFLVV